MDVAELQKSRLQGGYDQLTLFRSSKLIPGDAQSRRTVASLPAFIDASSFAKSLLNQAEAEDMCYFYRFKTSE